MRRSLSGAALVALAAAFLGFPAAGSAQVGFIIGGGVSSPSGDFANAAKLGYQGRAGIQIGIPMFPLSFRAEGEVNRFNFKEGAGHETIAAGTASAILSMSGVGISPYLIAGLGMYHQSASIDLGILSGSGSTNDVGYHVGLGLKAGALGFGGFLEARFVDIPVSGGHTRYFPISVGLRFGS